MPKEKETGSEYLSDMEGCQSCQCQQILEVSNFVRISESLFVNGRSILLV